MTTTYAPFDVADYLDNDEVIAEYLSVAMEDSNSDVFLAALRDVVRARGVAQISEASGSGRESFYEALRPGSHPGFETVSAALKAIGVKLAVVVDSPIAILEGREPV